MLLEGMTDSPCLRGFWIEKADRRSCHGGFARSGIPATRSQLACPIRVQGRALKSCLVLCLAIFGTQLCLFRRALFLVVDELSTLGRRPDNCTGPSPTFATGGGFRLFSTACDPRSLINT